MFDQPYRKRIFFVAVLFGIAIGGIIARLYYLQIERHSYYVRLARAQHLRPVAIRPKRGSIYDRNRRELATSSLLESLYADTSRLPKGRAQLSDLASRLSKVLDLPAETIYARLAKRGHPPIARTLSPETARRVRNLITDRYLIAPGALYFVRESKRHYPNGPLACHVLGFTTFDHTGENLGLAGLEYEYDKQLRGNYKKFLALRDARSRLLTPIDEDYYSAAFGNDLILTIDGAIQHVAETALRRAIKKYSARCGVVIVQKCKTGEILAMASWPDFDPNRYAAADPDSRRNRAIGHAFGLGSVMKIFTAAALLATGKLGDLDEPINCHNGVAYFPHRAVPVRDAPGHRLGIVPFREAFKWSSNCGMVEAAQRMSKFAYAKILESFGFGRKTGIDLPGESKGILRPVSQWSPVSMYALPYGGEMAVTPIQLVAAVSAIANGGRLMKPFVVKEIRTYEGRLVRRMKPTVVRRVVSPVVAREVLELMEEVVGHKTPDGRWDGGTGRKAAIPGYRVGGKTGTYKWVTRGRPGERPTSYTASFVAVLPLPDPELTVFCCIDEPHGEKYGGSVAAPVVRQVAEYSLRILGIPPNRTDRTPADLELTLSRLRERNRKRAATSAPRGRMPDLHGLTMREVSKCLAGLNLQVTFEGTGVVVSQYPPPLTRLRDVKTCKVVFGSPEAFPAQQLPAP